MSDQPSIPNRAMPSRGAVAGIKSDLKNATQGGEYNPNGTGTAWTHNFLNQKPWHPANFRQASG